jgi:hypothetical protein
MRLPLRPMMLAAAPSVPTFLGLTDTAWIALGVFATFGALVVAWWIYRSQQRTQRRGLLLALAAELGLHHSWVGTPYQPDCWPAPGVPGGWWSREQLVRRNQPGIVYKLSTVAVDAGIEHGPALFINPTLVVALVRYRQRAAQFNQLIDIAADLLAVPDMWRRRASKQIWERYALTIAEVHWKGIGTTVTDSAHRHFIQVMHELNRERGASRAARLFWFLVGRTWQR